MTISALMSVTRSLVILRMPLRSACLVSIRTNCPRLIDCRPVDVCNDKAHSSANWKCISSVVTARVREKLIPPRLHILVGDHRILRHNFRRTETAKKRSGNNLDPSGNPLPRIEHHASE